MQQIPDHHRHARLQRIQDRVVARESYQLALHLEPDNPAMRHPRSQTKHRGARTAADIEDELLRLGRHRGGEKHRVDGGTITFRRLTEADAATEQTVLSEGGLDCPCVAHPSSSPAAASSAQARL